MILMKFGEILTMLFWEIHQKVTPLPLTPFPNGATMDTAKTILVDSIASRA